MPVSHTSAHGLALESFWDPPVRHNPLNCSPRVRSGLCSSTHLSLSLPVSAHCPYYVHETVPLSQFLPLQLDVQLFLRWPMCSTSIFPWFIFSLCQVNSPFYSSSVSCSSSLPDPGHLHRSFFMASFITVFLLMRSSTDMNNSGLSTLPCLSPILTSNSSDAPSPTTTLVVVFSYTPSTILTSASGTPIHHSVAITISLGTVSKAFSKSTNPRAILPCTSGIFSTICLRTYIPSAVPLPFLDPCCSSPKSCSTLLLILASKTLSSSFSTWLSSVMLRCTSTVLFHIGTIRPILHSFGILPSCIHTFSSLSVLTLDYQKYTPFFLEVTFKWQRF